ncbi:MAG: serine/threonine-protein kinase [Myxococcota bacterium]
MKPGQVIDDYEVWGRISRGGMSEVYLARHQELGIPVVVKTMRPELASDETLSGLMFRAARLMARIADPHTVRILDVGEIDGAIPYLVEEYIDGVDLSELSNSRRSALRRPLPLWAVARWIAEAAQGLHAAHQSGVLHRDVKPANLFLTGDGRVKVGDFGVAVEAATASTGRAAGTLDFMAPEVLLGEDVDRRADVYSLGATAFALRYGMPPFSSSKEACAGSVRPRFPMAASPYEAFFQHVVASMLSTRPDARPATALDAGKALLRLSRPLQPRLAIHALDDGIEVSECRVRILRGDIADVRADAIVNSAYAGMRMQKGVGKALRNAGGDIIEEEAMKGGEQPLGTCLETTAGDLQANVVLHTVSAWKKVSCVARATHRALILAERGGHKHVAMPAIGTGQGDVAFEACAQAIANVLELHLRLGGSNLEELTLVLFNDRALAAFRDVFNGAFLSGRSRETAMANDSLLPTSSEDFTAPTLHAVGSDSSSEG